jgi:hypothetical protein
MVFEHLGSGWLGRGIRVSIYMTFNAPYVVRGSSTKLKFGIGIKDPSSTNVLLQVTCKQ